MKLNELVEKYKEMRPAKRRLLMIVPAAMLIFALMTAPHSPSLPQATQTLAASTTSDCSGTKLRMSVFGRSLMAYEWQSGNCPSTPARTRTINQ